MRRALLVPLLALLAIPSGASGGQQRALKELYSSGSITAAIPDDATLEHTITVKAKGELRSVLAFHLRLDHARDSDLDIRLVAPNGKSVLLSAGNGGNGADYGSGSRDCLGTPTVFFDGPPSITSGTAPFVGSFSPQQPLAKLKGTRTDGVWKLRITDTRPGATGTLYCWRLAVERRPATVERAHARATTAELSYIKNSVNQRTLNSRLKLVRAGKVLYDRALPTTCSYCAAWPSGFESGTGSLKARDLDRDGEPEVIVDLYTGGAHCCFFSRLYRYAGGRYVELVHWWGDPGYRLLDLDRDRRPEFLSYDDRFAYAFSCFACSGLPVQLWDYRAGRLRNVTRRFPAQIRADARVWRRAYLEARRQHFDYSGFLPAWLADQYMLGRGESGWKQVRAAVARREFKQWWKPARYLRTLRAFLRRTGYIR